MAHQIVKAENPVEESDILNLRKTVEDIIDRVKKEGDEALRYYEKKFDNFSPDSFRVTEEMASRAEDQLPSEIISELDLTIARVTRFAQAQKDSMREFEMQMQPGVVMGQRIVPVASCGCYVPAGRYPCLSSAIMSVIPARVAGVERIVAVSPPGAAAGINPGILYTMFKMGVDEIYCLGGAQAIAALAHGTETIPPVDLVVGPGNRYVMEAKRQVFGTVGIDFLAGPSEILIIADHTARADFLAADLLAQCEHDPNARGALIALDPSLPSKVAEEIEKQLPERSTEAVARVSWNSNGMIAVVDDPAEAAELANQYAPEHLEIHMAEPRKIVPLLKNYGALFIGENAAEVYGDKVSGTNHILPTGRAARYCGGLWVGAFLKVITHQEMDTRASLEMAKATETLAAYEGMDAHRYSATIRRNNLK